MDFWRSLAGTLQIQLRSADPSGALKQLSNAQIPVFDITPAEDGITLSFWIRRMDYRHLTHLANKRGLEIEILRQGGLYWAGIRMLHRPVLLLGLSLLLILGAYLPTRVLFFRVEGNSRVPASYILERCELVGMGFGASRGEVRSERVKNALLEVTPQLQWVGVNTSGCVATITVKERPLEDSPRLTFAFSSIVASRDGVITSCTADKGNLLCKPGQAVKKGQVLISGYTDCNLTIQLTQAQGEVYAQTSRELSVYFPANTQHRGEITGTSKKYALIIGKKRINFYKGSGISGSVCDKMYEETYLTLPGGFQLPVCLVTEVWTEYQCTQQKTDSGQAEQVLKDFSRRYLPSTMIAGRVLQSVEQVTDEESTYLLRGNYACVEMIGLEKDEGIVTPNGKYD